MLVLTRKTGQVIVIGDDAQIEVMVVEVRGGQVRIGITAPRDVPIDRTEIAALKKAADEALTKSSDTPGTVSSPR